MVSRSILPWPVTSIMFANLCDTLVLTGSLGVFTGRKESLNMKPFQNVCVLQEWYVEHNALVVKRSTLFDFDQQDGPNMPAQCQQLDL